MGAGGVFGKKKTSLDRLGSRYRRTIGFHSLRHTFASTLLSRGVSVKAVGDWLGHANAMITLSTYAHLMPADEDVARAVSDADSRVPRTNCGQR